MSQTEPDEKMRIGLGAFSQPSDDIIAYTKQLGLKDVQPNMYKKPYKNRGQIPLDGDNEWSLQELRDFKNSFTEAGLRLSAIENIPYGFYYKLMFGLEGRDKQLTHIKNTVRNIGKAGIPVLAYNWMPVGVWRTSPREGRGGAKVDAFDRNELDEMSGSEYMKAEDWADHIPDKEYSEEEFWEHYEYFVKHIIPVAEKWDVTLALHPNDPPIPYVGGYPSLFRNLESIKRAMDIYPSENHGLVFCLGSWSAMNEDIYEGLRFFGERDEIVYVHFRDVEGTVPAFNETFVDEGNYDSHEVLKILDDVGFSGVITSDHVPELVGDEPPLRPRGRAYTVGYLRGILESLNDA